MDQNRSFFLHALTYAWVLFLIGIGMLAWFHGLGLERKLKENTALAVELKQGSTKAQIQEFRIWLEQQEQLIPASIRLIEAKDYQNLIDKEMVSQDSALEWGALMPVLIIFKLKQEFLDKQRLSSFEESVYKHSIVSHFSYQNEITSKLSNVVDRIRMIFLGITLVFILVGILISDYLAQVFVDSRTGIIRSWNELGTNPQKIIQPYLKRASLLGLASACMSVFIMGIIILLINYLLPWGLEWLEIKKFFYVLLILLILGPTLQYFFVKRKILSVINN